MPPYVQFLFKVWDGCVNVSCACICGKCDPLFGVKSAAGELEAEIQIQNCEDECNVPVVLRLVDSHCFHFLHSWFIS